MPPRYAYWTIIMEGAPTAFRAHTAEELLPTLKQLQARHPDTVMKWFARGKLWDSPEQARMVAEMKKRAPRDRRTDEWRPGGAHRDPRARFKVPRDEKRRRFAANLRRDRTDTAPAPKPPGPSSEGQPRPPFENRRPGKPFGGHNKTGDRARPQGRDRRGPDTKFSDRPKQPFGKRPPRGNRRGGPGRGGPGRGGPGRGGGGQGK